MRMTLKSPVTTNIILANVCNKQTDLKVQNIAYTHEQFSYVLKTYKIYYCKVLFNSSVRPFFEFNLTITLKPTIWPMKTSNQIMGR